MASNGGTKGQNAAMINHQHIQEILALQIQSIREVRSSREMLVEFNEIYLPKLAAAGKNFQQHAKLLRRLTADFQEVFSRIRVCRHKIDRAIGRPAARSWDEEQADEDWDSDDEVEESSDEPEESGNTAATSEEDLHPDTGIGRGASAGETRRLPAQR